MGFRAPRHIRFSYQKCKTTQLLLNLASDAKRRASRRSMSFLIRPLRDPRHATLQTKYLDKLQNECLTVAKWSRVRITFWGREFETRQWEPVKFYRRPKLLAFSDQMYTTVIHVDAPTLTGKRLHGTGVCARSRLSKKRRSYDFSTVFLWHTVLRWAKDIESPKVYRVINTSLIVRNRTILLYVRL